MPRLSAGLLTYRIKEEREMVLNTVSSVNVRYENPRYDGWQGVTNFVKSKLISSGPSP